MHTTTLTKVTSTVVAVIAGATALLAADAALAEDKAAAYKMVVFSDKRHGQKVANGKYDEAIQRITSAPERKRDTFETKTNLCVAYTKSGDLEKAEASCDAALAYIRKRHAQASQSSTSPYGAEFAYDKYLALALSNRGVLHAVNGDMDSARTAFEAAAGLKAGLSVPKGNLARLGADGEQS